LVLRLFSACTGSLARFAPYFSHSISCSATGQRPELGTSAAVGLVEGLELGFCRADPVETLYRRVMQHVADGYWIVRVHHWAMLGKKTMCLAGGGSVRGLLWIASHCFARI